MTRIRHRRRARTPLARLSTTPLYESCATALNREIESGVLRPGQRLPSERSLGDALGFTRLTVRRALQVLARRGLLEPDEHRGWQVRNDRVSDSLSTLVGFTRVISDRTYRATIWDVIVRSSYQGRGIGGKLVQAVLDHPDLKTVTSFLLLTKDKHRFYERLGFESERDMAMVLRR